MPRKSSTQSRRSQPTVIARDVPQRSPWDRDWQAARNYSWMDREYDRMHPRFKLSDEEKERIRNLCTLTDEMLLRQRMLSHFRLVLLMNRRMCQEDGKLVDDVLEVLFKYF